MRWYHGVAWFVGGAAWDIAYAGNPHPPYPSFADIPWLAWYPLVALGIFYLYHAVRFWRAIRVITLHTHAGDLLGHLVGLEEHRLLYQKVEVGGDLVGSGLLRPAGLMTSDNSVDCDGGGDAGDQRQPAEATMFRNVAHG